MIGRIVNLLPGWTLRSGDGWLMAANNATCLAEQGEVVVASTGGGFFNRQSRKLIGLEQLSLAVSRNGIAEFDQLAAPFRILAKVPDQGGPTPFFDEFGLGHLFAAEHQGLSLQSSSPRLLARLTAAAPDRQALMLYAQLGAFPFAATPYTGVRKLLPPDPWGQSFSTPGHKFDPDQVRAALKDAFVDAVQASLEAAPDAALELSGGLDSRLILAAMSPAQRRGRTAITLCSAGELGRDVVIARKLASRCSLEHHLVHRDNHLWDDPDTLSAALSQACDAYELMGNPVDKATLLALNNDTDGQARFSGQNGEILRGFYHPLQPIEAPASAELVERLLDWRLIANDRVTERLLAPGAMAEFARPARTALLSDLSRFDGQWGQAIDRIYLRLRMQSWVGNAVSSNRVKRTILMPFFDRQFVHVALQTPSAARSDSMAAYRLLHDLDPALAAIPLASGIVPARALKGGLAWRLSQYLNLGAKLLRKVGQRITPNPASVMGDQAIIDTWHRHRGYERLDRAKLEQLAIFAPAPLDAILTGKLKPNRAELGFLLICESV